MGRSIRSLILALALTAGGCGDGSTPGSKGPPYRAADGAMRTADGQALYLRGVNLSGQAKSTTDHLFPVDAALLDTLRENGLNSVRLLTFWDAVTPDEPAVIDAAYLAGVADRVRALDKAGVYVIVDMHQDLWGHPFSGHGAPAWACPEEISAGYEATSPWWANYLSSQISGCFDRFWSSDELQAHFADAWVAVAGAVCGADHLLGFDLLNEPWPGTGLGNARFDNEVLLPFYRTLMARIDAVCPGRLFFLEPSASFTFGIAAPMDLPSDRLDRIVVAPHYYPSYVHEPDGAGYDGDAAALRANFLAGLAHYMDQGAALWLGEYGGMTDSTNFGAYFSDLHAILVEHLISSALWDYYQDAGGFALLDADGNLKPVYRPVLRTPLPTRLPNVPAGYNADWAAGRTQVDVRCERGKGFTLLLPALSPCSCAVDPPEALNLPAAPKGVVDLPCRISAQVHLDCACP